MAGDKACHQFILTLLLHPLIVVIDPTWVVILSPVLAAGFPFILTILLPDVTEPPQHASISDVVLPTVAAEIPFIITFDEHPADM